MTAKDLIRKLRQWDTDLEVRIFLGDQDSISESGEGSPESVCEETNDNDETFIALRT